MYVCQCRAVTERNVRAEIADGAGDLHDLAARCGAGSRCGNCRPTLEELLVECRRESLVLVRSVA